MFYNVNFNLLTCNVADLCASPTACGTNAGCIMHNHQKQCTCPPPLLGNADIGCHHMVTPCVVENDCEQDQTCYALNCVNRCKT